MALAIGVAIVLFGAVGSLRAAAPVATNPIISAAAGGVTPMAIAAPRSAFTSRKIASTDCTLPDGSLVDFLHCYTPQDIRSFYGVDSVAPIGDSPNYGQGQTIVLVDSYGSPTAAGDLQHFHDTFFPSLPDPSFKEIYPLGNPQFPSACKIQGLSGPCSAANWSGEAALRNPTTGSTACCAHAASGQAVAPPRAVPLRRRSTLVGLRRRTGGSESMKTR